MYQYTLVGACSPNGTQYVILHDGHGSALLPRSTFSVANKNLTTDLANAGIQLFQKKEVEALLRQVGGIDDFLKPALIAEQPGWLGQHFATLGAELIPPATEGEAWITFSPAQGARAKSGKYSSWKKHVGRLVENQPLTAFCIMAMLLPAAQHLMPFPDHSVVEIVGKSGIGKSTIQQICASLVGAAGPMSHASYIQPFAQFVDGDAKAGMNYRDHPVILDGVAGYLVTASSKAMASAYKKLVYDTSHTGGSPMMLVSGTSSLADFVKSGAPPSNLITLVVPDDAPFGAFEAPPSDFTSGADFAEHLATACRADQGQVYRHFISRLQRAKTKDEEALRLRLAGWQDDFLRQLADNGLHNVDQRRARIFAAVYAVGMQACRMGTLPKTWHCMNATLHCYALATSRRVPEAPQPFGTRLQLAIAGEAILTLTSKKKSPSIQKEAQAALGVLHQYAGKRELRVHPDNILKLFPDWSSIRKRTDVRELLKADGRNLCAKAALAPGMTVERMYCFNVPANDEPQARPENDNELPLMDWADCLDDNENYGT